MLKSYGGWVVVVAYRILVSAQGPLVFGLELKGFGPGLDNLCRSNLLKHLESKHKGVRFLCDQ